ncbi:hotdog fold thioesterase [Aureibacter tunicatorum]|uniref:1,4-dihydroxy-2-naphthoyl-CoA hydrolase n=1 Tax=Aureibacter tunicatorum TaxID=866807 RepID=A0AAE3XM15_9BACT|nr:hotdog fold thioesterase [Aureibacter tunicatorum]MDR6239073.1 1,4-dihydroxy-2-naphthoyl-CoA hydrolase [Aureibacter tunicatorum]BDD05001.1 hypothetical protein AUTU_24840 [Aureibacter tunicatorum]
MLNTSIPLEQLNAQSKNTLIEHLNIRYTEITESYIKGTMPVNPTTHQPLGLLHGGASAALAETLASVGANLTINPKTHYCVGLEINANHIKSVKDGIVTGIATPLHMGRTTQVWEIRISNEDNKLLCISRMTVAVMAKK